MDYTFHQEAREEFLQSAVFYESEVPTLGDRFVSEINRCIGLLLDAPLSGSLVSERLRSYAVNDHFPFSIIYAVRVEAILIVAIAHQSRRPGYWKHRLPLRSV